MLLDHVLLTTEVDRLIKALISAIDKCQAINEAAREKHTETPGRVFPRTRQDKETE